jgi:glycine/D-amino acid oxidase-like deaminating enzyme
MTKLRSQWGTAPWERPHSVALENYATPSTTTPDVAIVGGGLTGTSAAYHLARLGIQAVLFETGLVGDGASGRTGGLVLEGTAAGVLGQVHACVPGLKRLVDKEEIDCDLALPGCWEIEHRKVAPARMLPWSDDGRPVGIARTVSGGVVQPAALTLGIARAAMRLGAIIREQSPVTRIALGPELSLEAGGARIRPGHLIVATNAWIDATLPDLPPLQSSLTFACATEPLDVASLAAIGLGEGVPFYTSDLPYLWGRTIRDGRVIFGAGLVFGEPADLEHTDVREGSSGAVLDRLQKRVRGLHPALHEVRFDAAWAGPIAFADGSIPVLGPHPANPRVLVSGGYAGHGVALSVRAGELLALAIGKNTPLPKWGALSR